MNMKWINTSALFLAGSIVLSSLMQPLMAQIPAGKDLLPAGLSAFRYYGKATPDSIVRQVRVSGQSFDAAYEVNTFRQPSGSRAGLEAFLQQPLSKGDVLWISFKARCLESKRETGEAFVELNIEQLVNGVYRWPSYLERGISIGSQWTETSIPFVVEKNVRPEDIRVTLRFDTYPQRFELGPVSFINYGPGVKLSDLPRSRVRYAGDEPDAAWRTAAAANIEKYRKGDLKINVVDKNGRPVKDASVTVRMKRHHYTWSTATSSQRLLDTVNPNSRIYRDTLLKYFNQVVFENEMKWPYWTGPRKNHQQTFRALNWLKEKHIPVRGTVMIWPSWQHLPAFLQDIKDDTAALREATFKFIKEQTTTMKGQFTEWDITNELYAHHDLVDILGKEEIVKWYRAVHEVVPEVKLFYNEYTMFHKDGPGSPSEHFYESVKYLKEQGTPLYGIGEQGHIGGTPPGIPMVIERLNKFAELGFPIQISEFDITSNDEDFKAAYLKDFMTAVYSHPSTIGIIQWGFWEGQHWFPIAALWNRDWSIRPSGKAYTDLVFKDFWTNAEGKSGKDGSYAVRGYCGDYEINVRSGSKTQTQTASLDREGTSIRVSFN